jgi:hypothetical protein
MLISYQASRTLTILCIALPLLSFQSMAQPVMDGFMERLLKRHPTRFGDIFKKKADYDIQILYTKIDRNRKKVPYFTTYRYHVSQESPTYPGGTIPLAAAALTLEKINLLKIPNLDKDTPMQTLAERPSQTKALTDTTSPNGLPSLGHYIKKMLLAGDEDAYNRLYEFLGQDYFNERMQEKGYSSFKVTQRVGLHLGAGEDPYTNPIRFVNGDRVIYDQAGRYSEKNFEPHAAGSSSNKKSLAVNKSLDYSPKNTFGLADQQLFLKNLMFPEQAMESQKLDLTKKDYLFLYQYLSQLPIETDYPAHYSEVMEDASVKLLLFGKTKKRTPRQIRSFNSSGESDGYLWDNAYFVDFEMGVEFLLSAVMKCHPDSGPQGSPCDYSRGYQFMADLGKTVFEYELARKRDQRPDLEELELEYDK